MTIHELMEEEPHLRRFKGVMLVPVDPGEVLQEYPEAEDSPDLLERGDREVVSFRGIPVTRLTWYYISRARGTKHRMAVALAMQQTAATATTDTFWSGRAPWYKVYGEQYANEVRAEMAKHGRKLGENEEYEPQLARFKGDPQAVVPFSGIRDHIKAECLRRGASCEGAVNVRAASPDSDPLGADKCVPLGEDIIQRRVKQYTGENPDLARKSRAELRQMVLDRHAPKS